MSKRLEVLLDDVELLTIQQLARRDKLTTSEWVRRRLREGAAANGRPDVASKLAAIQTAYRYQQAPAPEIDQMLEEIERGRTEEAPGSPA